MQDVGCSVVFARVLPPSQRCPCVVQAYVLPQIPAKVRCLAAEAKPIQEAAYSQTGKGAVSYMPLRAETSIAAARHRS